MTTDDMHRERESSGQVGIGLFFFVFFLLKSRDWFAAGQNSFCFPKPHVHFLISQT